MHCPDSTSSAGWSWPIDRLTLGPDEIHLWFALTNELYDPLLIQEYLHILSDAEHDRRLSFSFERDRHQYLVARALVRSTLSRYTDVRPRDWSFGQEPMGRPFVQNDSLLVKAPSFNISHTDGLVVIGLTQSSTIGVDTESIEGRPSLEIAERFFARDEVSALSTLDGKAQAVRFFEHWTLKEAYAKARGLGLSLPFDWLSFNFSRPKHIDVSFQLDLMDDPSSWRFWLLQPFVKYVVAVCAPRVITRPQIIVLRNVIPLRFEQQLNYAIYRDSESPRRKSVDGSDMPQR